LPTGTPGAPFTPEAFGGGCGAAQAEGAQVAAFGHVLGGVVDAGALGLFAQHCADHRNGHEDDEGAEAGQDPRGKPRRALRGGEAPSASWVRVGQALKALQMSFPYG
jgi:hypothetical protein